jgi:6-phosphogluconate dehydrogenase
MQLGIYGLGRMGANMARRLSRGGIDVVAHNRSAGPIDELVAEESRITAAYDLKQFIAALPLPRIVWLMLPAGDITGQAIEQILPMLSAGDLLIDGGNSFYQDTMARAAKVQQSEVYYMDVGTSGGVWGLNNGYSLMVGGSKEAFALIEPAIRVLAPSADHGWGHVGPVGSGHYVKMVHNGIEYGMMQALAEGLAVLRAKKAFDLDLAQITEHIAPVVADSGEGRWTAKEAIDLGVSAPVMTLALQMRFASQDAEGYGNRLLSLMRNAFGGHAITRK